MAHPKHARFAPLAISLLLAGAAATAAAAAQDDQPGARQLLRSGKYAEAAEMYARTAPQDPIAAVGLARSLAAQGKHDEAVRALEAVEGEHADLRAELARLAFDRGDYPETRNHVDASLALDADQLLARWIDGELLRTAGRLEEAEAAYRWLIRFYNEHQDGVRRAESLHWIGLAAARYARWNRLSDQFAFLVNELYPDALRLEPDYWPAHYQSGLLFLEKYNQADAAAEFDAALELNPRAAQIHVAIARLAMRDRKIEKARASLERAAEINPRCLELHLVLADLAWANFRPEKAAEILTDAALPINAVSEAVLGRLAACYVVADGLPGEGEAGPFPKLVAEVTARNEHAGEFFYTLGSRLRERHKLSAAERFFGEAIRRMPQLVGPQAELGMLYMDAGEETKARSVLDAAFEADPFNMRVDNMLKVLDRLDAMETRRTEHGVLKFDGEHDALLIRYAARRLDAIYPELCDLFGYVPPGPPLVEIFHKAQGVSGQQWFGTRLIGLPYLGTVAASTGRMVGMVSPNDPDLSIRFNWAQTLEHELVHVITLQQTDFNIPHWYTEGLAVWCEGYPRPQKWNELLARRSARGELFDLKTINFAFSRPNSGADWQMAYCQSELYVEYMLAGRSPEVLRSLLAAYAEGRTTSEAVERVFGVSEAEFERGFRKFVERVVAEMPVATASRLASFAELLGAHRDRPDDADLCAQVAVGYLERGASEEALDAAEHARKQRPKHPLATYVVARLEAKAGRPEKAVELLEKCLDREAPEPRVLNLLASLHLKAERFDEAARLYQLGAERDPHNSRWWKALARVYLTSGDDQRLAPVLARLAETEPDDLAVRKKLAEIARAREDFDGVGVWANRALEIDVSDAELHRMIAEAALRGHNLPEAIEEFRTAVELGDESPSVRVGLAKSLWAAGRRGEARQELDALLEREPDHSEAGSLRTKWEENGQE